VLVGILSDEPCQAKHNLVADNVLCDIADGASAFDVTPAIFASWDSVMRNNTVGAC
jgi:hypothetical protein